jgi:hypothetical protein
MLWEQNNILREQDSMLWEQIIFPVGTYFVPTGKIICSHNIIFRSQN